MGTDLGFKLGLPFSDFFSMGFKAYDISHTWSKGKSEHEHYGDDQSSQKYLLVEKFKVNLSGKFNRCVLLRGKKYYPSYNPHVPTYNPNATLGTDPLNKYYKSQYQVQLKKNFYLCTKPLNYRHEESWYFLQASLPSEHLLTDNFGPTELRFFKVIRNKDNFKKFENLLRDNTKTYLLKKEISSEGPDLKLYESWGHMMRQDPEPSAVNKLIMKNTNASFPGTIQINQPSQ